MRNKVDFTKPVRFRITGTVPVRVVAYDLPAGHLIGQLVCAVVLSDSGKEYADMFQASLFENIPPEPGVGYVNFYKDYDGCTYGGEAHRNRALADRALAARVAAAWQVYNDRTSPKLVDVPSPYHEYRALADELEQATGFAVTCGALTDRPRTAASDPRTQS